MAKTSTKNELPVGITLRSLSILDQYQKPLSPLDTKTQGNWVEKNT